MLHHRLLRLMGDFSVRMALLCIGISVPFLLHAQGRYIDQKKGGRIWLAYGGQDNFDVHHYGLACFQTGWGDPDDETNVRFLLGDNTNTQRNYVHFWHAEPNSSDYQSEVNAGRRFPDMNKTASHGLIWIFMQAVDDQDPGNTSAFSLWNYGQGGYIIKNGNNVDKLQSGTHTPLGKYDVDENNRPGFKITFRDRGNRLDLNAYFPSCALAFNNNASTRDIRFRAYEVWLTHRENVILEAMKRSVGMFAGASATDFSTITTELNKHLIKRDYEKVRTELTRLQNLYQTKTTTLPDGFYRIKSAAANFKTTDTRILYVDNGTKTVKWKEESTGTAGIWRIKRNSDGTYTMTHYDTGYTFVGPGQAAKKLGTDKVNISILAQNQFPGHFSISTGDNYLHAQDWGGNNPGTTGNTMSYNKPEEADENRFYNIFRGTDKKREFHSASSWFFQTVQRPDLSQDLQNRIKELLAAKDVARGFTSQQLQRLEQLKSDPLALPAEIEDEIEKLLDETITSRIPFKEGFYTIINAHPDFEGKPNRLMYAEPNGAPLWHVQNTPQPQDIWYVMPMGTQGYVITNVNSSFSMQAGYTVLKPQAYSMTVFEFNKNKYPARFLIHDAGNSYAHALGHHQPSGNQQGSITSHYTGSDYQKTDGTTFDGASAWKLKPILKENVPNSPTLNNIAAMYKASEGRVFGYTAEQLSVLKNADNTADRFIEIHKQLRNKQRITPDANGLNRIYNAAEKYKTTKKTIYVDYTTNALKWHSGDATKVDELWKIVPNGNNYQVTNPNTGGYIDDPSSLSPSTTPKSCKIIELDPYTHPSIVKIVGNEKTFNPKGNGDGAPGGAIGHWDRSNAQNINYVYQDRSGNNVSTVSLDQTSTWYIEPATTIGLTTSVLGSGSPKQFFLTFYYPFAVELPDELSMNSSGSMWAYVERNGASSERPGYILVKPVRGKKIKPLTPVVLETRERRNLITLKIIPENQADVEVRSQVWKGVLAPMEIPAGSYIMINHSSWSGFHRTTESGYIAANRVYVQGSGTVSAPHYFGIQTEDESTTTGVEEMTSEEVRKSPVLYDMMGRRVTNPGKGIYVTSEGKKIYKL